MRKRALILASLTVVAFAGVVSAASATTIETTGGSVLASGTAINGFLKSGTNAHLEGGSSGDIDCSTSTFAGTLGTNPATPSVSGSLTSLSFSGCTDTIPFVTVSSVSTNVSAGSPKTATATYVGAASTFAISGVEVTVTFSSGSTCKYKPSPDPATAQHNSLSNPKNNEYAFSAVPVDQSGGSFFACPDNATWTATYKADRTSDGADITIQD